MNEALSYMSVLRKHSNHFFSNTFYFSWLSAQFYGKQAKSTCATHQGNRSPIKIMIFMAFFRNMDSQNTVPSIGFQSLFIHIFSNFHHCYLVSKTSHDSPAKYMEVNSVLGNPTRAKLLFSNTYFTSKKEPCLISRSLLSLGGAGHKVSVISLPPSMLW